MAGTNEGTIRLYELNQFELINELRPFKFDANSIVLRFSLRFLIEINLII